MRGYRKSAGRILVRGFLLAVGLSTCNARAVGQNGPDYLSLVRGYADTMITHARDTYESEYSPLFASGLSRDTHSLMSSAPEIDGIRSYSDRSYLGSNPMHDQQLYHTLYKLSEVTGDPQYASEADAALQWFFQNTQNTEPRWVHDPPSWVPDLWDPVNPPPATYLMPWGEHMGWNFRTEERIIRYGTGADGMHEFFEPWRLWDRIDALAPTAAFDFAQGLWDHQIHDQNTGAFSRHARYEYQQAFSGHEYPRHGGYFMTTWAEAYDRSDDPTFRQTMLTALEVLSDSFTNRRLSNGVLPAGSETRNMKTLWPMNNLDMAISAFRSAELVPEPLAQELRDLGAATDNVFLRMGHDLSPGGHGFINRAWAETLEPGSPQGAPDIYTETWDLGYGSYTHAGVGVFCLERYQQVGLEDYRTLVMETAALYLDSDPDTSIQLYPEAVADAIELMLGVYKLTGDDDYLERAHEFGSFAEDIFFDEISALPKATSQHSHYETITGGDDLVWQLLQLHQIPEPSTLVLICGGALVIFLQRRLGK